MIVVDRIEGTFAVLDVDGLRVDFPLSALPEGCKEGDRLTLSRQPGDTTEAEARLARLKAKFDQGPGSIDL